MILADWFAHLGAEAGYQFSQFGSSGQALIIGSPGDFHVKARYSEAPPYLEFEASEATKQAETDALAQAAAQRVERREFGGLVWYSTELEDAGLELSASFTGGGLLERLNSQTRIGGSRRLGRDILLEFREAPAEAADQLLAPKASVTVHVAAPGPRVGYFASYVAHTVVETVASICTFALGRTVKLPPIMFPSDPKALTDLSARRTDSNIKTLARKQVSLDIFGQLSAPGGLEVFRKERAAFTTFGAAMGQERDLVACILYVVSAECLTMPDTQWRRRRITKRFIGFFEDLMPSSLDAIVAHGNFEEAFGIMRGSRSQGSLRRVLLDRLYDYRSGLVHGGLTPSYQGLGAALENGGRARRALFANFAEAAILGYLQSPRSSVVGRPASDPEGQT